MDNSMKKEMLGYVNEFESNMNFWRNDNKEKFNKQTRQKEPDTESGNLGSNNLRSLAVMAENAACLEELELFIQYKMARGNGWEKILKDGKPFGEIVIGHIKNIYEKSKEKDDNENSAMKNISLYFGYLYWKRRTLK